VLEAIKSAVAELINVSPRIQACGTGRYREIRLIRKNPYSINLGRASSLNVLGIQPPENQRLRTEISSRGRHTHGEEMYR